MYEMGRGVAKDLAEAFRLYHQAAGKKPPAALNRLGYCYEYGIGVTGNFEEFLTLYRQAADLGNPNAQYSLAIHVLDGKKTFADRATATEWLRKAAKSNYEPAKAMLKSLGISP